MNLYEYWNGNSTDEDLKKFEWNTEDYHKILCNQIPDFLEEYIQLPIVQHLDGIGLLCGTDWTPLFKNRFYYSRLDHSIGTALIVWNFTHSKKQTIAALLHDVSSPAFSHVNDFRKGDALKQEATEDLNVQMINENPFIKELIEKDGFNLQDINDYHRYPVCDNEKPGLSADRLEYMFPSGAALNEVWTMKEIEECYSKIEVLENEKGKSELGFTDENTAVEYTKKFCDISLILHHNEDKVAMQLMADVLSEALTIGLLKEQDLYTYSEAEIISMFDYYARQNADCRFSLLFRTFRTMKKVIHSEKEVDGCWCVRLDVKQRYVDPLVKTGENKCARISTINKKAEKIIKDFLSYKDTAYGCVPYAQMQ